MAEESRFGAVSTPNDLVWEDPPPARGPSSPRRVPTRWAGTLAKLKTRPGTWLRIRRGIREREAQRIRQSLSRHGVQVAVRHLEDGYGCWARWPLDAAAVQERGA